MTEYGGRRNWECLLSDMEFLFEMMKCSRIKYWLCFHNPVNILKIMNCTLCNGRIWACELYLNDNNFIKDTTR